MIGFLSIYLTCEIQSLIKNFKLAIEFDVFISILNNFSPCGLEYFGVAAFIIIPNYIGDSTQNNIPILSIIKNIFYWFFNMIIVIE